VARSSIPYDGIELVILSFFSWEEMVMSSRVRYDIKLLKDEQQVSLFPQEENLATLKEIL